MIVTYIPQFAMVYQLLSYMKLFKPYARLNVHFNFFTLQVINSWNNYGLPQEIVSSNTIGLFKAKLDKYWETGYRYGRKFRVNCIEAKKQLYISLVRSQIMYCSQIWRPPLIRDIMRAA